jgi:hypothetical protein
MAKVDKRNKNYDWSNSDDNGGVSQEQATRAVLMDIRDELQALRSLANCYRIPRALDALIEAGADARRRKRVAAKRRKAAKS